MSGSALLQVLVKEGDHVKKGQSLVVLEAMKVLPLLHLTQMRSGASCSKLYIVKCCSAMQPLLVRGTSACSACSCPGMLRPALAACKVPMLTRRLA